MACFPDRCSRIGSKVRILRADRIEGLTESSSAWVQSWSTRAQPCVANFPSRKRCPARMSCTNGKIIETNINADKQKNFALTFEQLPSSGSLLVPEIRKAACTKAVAPLAGRAAGRVMDEHHPVVLSAKGIAPPLREPHLPPVSWWCAIRPRFRMRSCQAPSCCENGAPADIMQPLFRCTARC